MNTASDMVLSKQRRWELASNLIQNKLTNKINYKYGWQSNDDFDDTYNDLFIITYEVIEDFEEKNNVVLKDINSISKDIKKNLLGKIIGKYRLSVWNNRSELNLRASDIYNISDSVSDERLTVYNSDNLQYVEDINSYTDIDRQEQYEIRERREFICSNLTSILKTDVETIVNACMLGDDYGVHTHLEIAKRNKKCRSGITRKINRAVITLRKFVNNNKITYQQILSPTKQDFELIKNLISEYKKAETLRLTKNSFLNINNFKKVNKLKVERRKKYKDNTLRIYVHSIEEYLTNIF